LSARIVTAGFLGALFGLSLVAVSPVAVHAAGTGAWSGHVAPAKRPHFRPWQPRVEQRANDARWRPHRAAGPRGLTTRYTAAARQAPLIAPEPRYTAPVTRAFARSVNVGVRFRPNSRAAVAAADRVQTTPTAASVDHQLQSQFRPRPERQRPSYEELQATSSGAAQRPWSLYPNQPAFGSTRSTAMAPTAGFPPYWRSW